MLLPTIILCAITTQVYASVLIDGHAASFLSSTIIRPPNELDLSLISYTSPHTVASIVISHAAIDNDDYTPLSQFTQLQSFTLKDVTSAPRMTSEFFQLFPYMHDFVIEASQFYHEVEFDQDTFATSKSLKKISIQRLYTVPRLNRDFLVEGLRELEDLAIDDGALSFIDVDAFDHVKKIVHLSLRNHGNITIQKYAFQKLEFLETLNLAGNLIEDFNWKIFGQLGNLQELVVSNIPARLINVGQITKHLPDLGSLEVHVANCFHYRDIPRQVKGYQLTIKLVDPKGTPC